MTFDFLPGMALTFFLIFARIGAMLMLMPALGESSIPARIRLTSALLLSLLLYPAVSPGVAASSGTFSGLAASLGTEIAIGLAIGFSTRLVISALQVAGATIAMQLSLSFAEGVDPNQGANSAILTNFLTVTAVALIFATDLHHLAIAGIVDSYTLFPPGRIPSTEDFAMMAITTITESFRVALQIAAPFIVFGLIFQLGLGLLSRLMPQIQIFFIAMPASIAVGLLLLALLIVTMMVWWSGHAETAFTRLLAR